MNIVLYLHKSIFSTLIQNEPGNGTYSACDVVKETVNIFSANQVAVTKGVFYLPVERLARSLIEQ